MKKYLWLSLAALGFVACEKGIDNENPQNGEKEQSYVAITLAAADINTSRAEGGMYKEGRDEERAVKSAYVFFFKDNAAFPVAFDGTTSTNAGSKNYLDVKLKGKEDDMPNVSDVKDAVLVLQKYKGEYPNQVVAVLNWSPQYMKDSYTLDDLKAEIATLGNDEKGYVMSNAVYEDKANETIDAVALTIANIGKTEQEALNNPVTIHVERVAAKVEFTAANKEGLFDTGEVVDGKKVYAKIEGFELYNDAEKSWLIKKINNKWDDENLGFKNWTDPDWNRSYWAQSIDEKPFGDNNHFDWVENDAALNGNSKDLNDYVYCGENTLAWSKAADVRTKVIVKATLVDADEKPFEVVNWYGKEYTGEKTLKTVVANTLATTYFYSTDGQSFESIKPEDIKCAERDPKSEKAYEVYFQLSEETDLGVNKSWYKYQDNGYQKIEDDKLNEELATVEPALVYNDGMTYYYTDIKHLGGKETTAEYGVVRNHIYKVNISAIKGFGTPVYNGETDFVTPEKPQAIETYVAAQINILTWRIVANDYPLE